MNKFCTVVGVLLASHIASFTLLAEVETVTLAKEGTAINVNVEWPTFVTANNQNFSMDGYEFPQGTSECMDERNKAEALHNAIATFVLSSKELSIKLISSRRRYKAELYGDGTALSRYLLDKGLAVVQGSYEAYDWCH